MEEKKITTPPTGHKNWEEELRDEILAEEKFPEEKKIPYSDFGIRKTKMNLPEEQEN